MQGFARALLGCEWGTAVALPGDTDPCADRAERYYALHAPDGVRYVKLCAFHGSLVVEHTDPHSEDQDRPLRVAPRTLCGVAGTVTLAPGVEPQAVPPCDAEATETVRMRCERGHDRRRDLCAFHADVLRAQAPFAPTFCVVCFDAEGIEVPLSEVEA